MNGFENPFAVNRIESALSNLRKLLFVIDVIPSIQPGPTRGDFKTNEEDLVGLRAGLSNRF